MTSAYVLTLVVTGIMAVFFVLALVAEKRAAQKRWTAPQGWIYVLALGVYCTSWTYYGSVSAATRSGPLFLTIYLGPTIGILLWPVVLRRMVELSKRHHLTSLSDLLAARYNKSQTLAVTATVLMAVGVAPYIALQINAVSSTMEMILVAHGHTWDNWGDSQAGAILAILMIVFAILFGARSRDESRQRPGLMAVLATQSVIKLIAFVALGVFVVLAVFGGANETVVSTQGMLEQLGLDGDLPGFGTWLSYLVLSMSAILFLPRQFHVAVVENTHRRHITKAMWALPAYLLAINLFVLPIAAAGAKLQLPPDQSDSLVLAIPLVMNQSWLAMGVFLGGLCAAMSMIIVTTIAISSMITNQIVLPVTRRIRILAPLCKHVLTIRRFAIACSVILGLAVAEQFGDSHTLLNMGMITFAAVFQFVPLTIGGLFWKRANALGAKLGLGGGVAVWTYTLLLPSLARSGLFGQSFVDHGPFAIEWLKPEALCGLAGLNPIAHTVIWTLLANAGLFVLGSLWKTPSPIEQSRTRLFLGERFPRRGTPVPGRHDSRKSELVDVAAKMTLLHESLLEFLPDAEARSLLAECADDLGIGGKKQISIRELSEYFADVESRLRGFIGSAAAHRVLSVSSLLSPREKRALEAIYEELVSELRLSPDELMRRVDFHQEKQRLLTEHAHDLEAEVARRTSDLEKTTLALQNELVQRERAEAERRELETLMLHKSRLESVGSLAAGIAHEINTPIQFVGDNTAFLSESYTELSKLLRAYQSFVEQLRGDDAIAETRETLRAVEGETDVGYLLEEIPVALRQSLEGVQHVATIVRAMKDFAHPSRTEKSTADLNQALQSTLIVARSELKGVADVVTDFDPSLPATICYIGDLNQVFLNLFINAAHAIEDAGSSSDGKRGTITVTTSHAEGEIIVRIGDTGTGIPEEVINRMFDPFFTTKEVGRGTGQGLSIAHSIVVGKHDGRIDVESTLGEGTTFIVHLPIKNNPTPDDASETVSDMFY